MLVPFGTHVLDRDGKSDLALVSASHHTVALLRGDGAGGFTLMFPAAARQ